MNVYFNKKILNNIIIKKYILKINIFFLDFHNVSENETEIFASLSF
jgi:hypothetical protein